MKKLFFMAAILAYLLSPYGASASINIPWSTTYDCADWNTYTDPLNCDGLEKGLNGWTEPDQKYTQITTAANYPGGAGGKGQRKWVGPGTNNGSGGISIRFNSAKTEFWMRWYMRWETGFGFFREYKSLYIYPPSGTGMVFQFMDRSGNMRLYSTVQSYRHTGGFGDKFYPTKTSDGSWHMFEVHFNIPNGVYQYWVDGELMGNFSNVDFGAINSISRITVGSNSKDVANSRSMYIDHDDIAIRSSGPIGPVGGTPPPGPTDPPPQSLSAPQDFDLQ
ncbi:hypothetical protein [Desulfogranum mediterraneum]|uniref:hypothetical protein n=1 Tax=Desulfogranum mediterraneum TaxID=160661 RepID=UPI000407C453|nr:hypothetical protein [Desulfogranum mediterraneum]